MMNKVKLTIWISILVLLSTFVVAQPASASTRSRVDVVKALVKSMTGTTAIDVTAVRGQRRMIQNTPQGTRHLAVLTRGQTSASFARMIPSGSRVTAYEGDYRVLTPTGVKMTVYKPWAVDATGKQLDTSYVFNGSTITQTVNTAGAVFPVVADPYVTLGWCFYIHFNPRYWTVKLWQFSQKSIWEEIAFICGIVDFGPVGIACSAYMLAVMSDINTTVNYANNAYHRCVVLRDSYNHLYLGSFVEYC